MKSKRLRYILCTMLVIIIFSVAACGDGRNTDINVENNGVVGTEEEGTADINRDEEGDGKGKEDEDTLMEGMYATMEEFANSAQIQGQADSLGLAGKSLVIKGENNKLIYTYTYKEVVNLEGVAESLKKDLEKQAEVFITLANICKSAVVVDNPVVVVEYIDANGELIHSQEFAAEVTQQY